MTLTINEAQLEFLSATIARVGEGLLTGGIALPALMAESYAEYMLFVRSVTPPATGARTVGSIDLSRGKMAIDVDLGRAFIVSARGAVMTLVGGQLVTKGAQYAGKAAVAASARYTVRAGAKVGRTVASKAGGIVGRRIGVRAGRAAGRFVTSRAQTAVRKAAETGVRKGAKTVASNVEAWYQSNRNSSGRFSGSTRMQIEMGEFVKLRQKMHSKVGQLQAGWNAATERFKMRAPSWISGKQGAGRVSVQTTKMGTNITGENLTTYANGVRDLQRRLDYAGRRTAQEIERRAAKVAEQVLQNAIK